MTSQIIPLLRVICRITFLPGYIQGITEPIKILYKSCRDIQAVYSTPCSDGEKKYSVMQWSQRSPFTSEVAGSMQ
jgi:hypothetical protein